MSSKHIRELQAHGASLGLVSRLDTSKAKHHRLWFSRYRGGPEQFITVSQGTVNEGGPAKAKFLHDITRIARELPPKPLAAAQSTIKAEPKPIMQQAVQMTEPAEASANQKFWITPSIDARGALRLTFDHKVEEHIGQRKGRLELLPTGQLVIILSVLDGRPTQKTRSRTDAAFRFKEKAWNWPSVKTKFEPMAFIAEPGKLTSEKPLPRALLEPTPVPEADLTKLASEGLQFVNNWLKVNRNAEVEVKKVDGVQQIFISARVVTETKL